MLEPTNESADSVEILEIQPSDDVFSIVDLFRLSLGEDGGLPEPTFWKWKHHENPFGVSPTRGAWDGPKLVGLRTFLCWRFIRDNESVTAFRAVDTSTHPDYRGRKLFTTLTLGLVEQLKPGQRTFIFNTPNAFSKSGYLKMGWREWGTTRLAVRFFPTNYLFHRIKRVTWPAISSDWNDAVAHAWAHLEPTVRQQFAGVFITDFSPAYFQWRYFRQPKLNYHYWIDSPNKPQVLGFFRLKISKRLRELRITDVFFNDRGSFSRMITALDRTYCPDVITYLPDDRGVLPVPFGFITVKKGLCVTYRDVNDSALTEVVMRNRMIYFSAGTLELF